MSSRGRAIVAVGLLLFVGGLVAVFLGMAFQPDDPYTTEIMDWRAAHEANMRRGDGYLAITGLFEVKHGRSRFGSGSDCEFRVTSAEDNPIPELIGQFSHVDGRTVFQSLGGTEVVDSSGDPVTGIPYMNPASEETKASTFFYGSLMWTIIHRGVAPPKTDESLDFLPEALRDSVGERIYIRVWDSRNPALDALKSPEYFPIDPAWRFVGEFRPYETSRYLYQKNVQGLVEESLSTGEVAFTRDGVEYTLETIDEGDNLFIVFGDETNGTKTWSGGRFMDVQKPTKGNTVVIDFNKTRNPWCAYSDYTTCALPTEHNTLPFAVDAGALPPSTSDK